MGNNKTKCCGGNHHRLIVLAKLARCALDADAGVIMRESSIAGVSRKKCPPPAHVGKKERLIHVVQGGDDLAQLAMCLYTIDRSSETAEAECSVLFSFDDNFPCFLSLSLFYMRVLHTPA